MKQEYPLKVIQFARRLHDEGRGIKEIRHSCKKYGYSPGWSTVKRWVDDDYRERERIRNITRRRKVYGHYKPETALDAMARRMKELRTIGISYADIAKILELDYGVRLNAERIRYSFNANDGRLTPRDMGRALNGLDEALAA